MNPIRGCTERVCPPEIITRLFLTNETFTWATLKCNLWQVKNVHFRLLDTRKVLLVQYFFLLV
jgi:hypothetical protein